MKQLTLLLLILVITVNSILAFDFHYTEFGPFLPPVQNTPIEYGVTLSGNLSVNGEIDTFSFMGQSGDLLILSTASTDFNYDPHIKLFSSGGNLVAENQNTVNSLQFTVELPSDGSFIIVLNDVGNNFAGNYGITINKINSPNYGGTFTFNGLTTGTISLPSQAELYHLDVPSDDPFVLLFAPDCCSLDPQIQVFDEQGELILAKNNLASTTLRIDTFLPVGTYTVLVMDFGGTESNGYKITIQQKNNNPNQQPLTFNGTTTGTISTASDINVYSLAIPDSKPFIFRFSPQCCSLDPQYEVYDNQGNLIIWNYNNGGTTVRQDTFLPAGNYSMLVMDYGGTETGNYHITLQQKINNPNQQPLAYNGTTTGTISTPSDINIYSLTVPVADPFLMRFVPACCSLDPEYEIYDSQGQLLLSYAGNQTINAVRLDTFLPPGNYTMFVMDYGGTESGDYHITIQQKINNPNQQPLAFNGTTAGTISTPSKINIYSLTVPVADPFLMRFVPACCSLDPEFEIYNGQGQLLLSYAGNQTINAVRLDTFLPPGNYTMFVMDYGGTESGDYHITIQQKINNPNQQPLAFNGTTAGTIGTPSKINIYSLTVPVADPFLLRFTPACCSLDPEYEIYNDQGQLLLSYFNSQSTTARLDTFLLPGNYTMFLMDYGGTETGDYHITIQQKINNPNQQPLIFNGTTTGTISTPSDINIYSLTVPVADPFLLRFTPACCSLDPEYEIYNDQGQLLLSYFNSQSTTVRLDTFLLPGNYTMFLMDYGGTESGDYHITIQQKINNPNQQPLAFNGLSTGTFSAPSDINVYSLEVPSDVPFALRFTPKCCVLDPQFEIYDTQANLLLSGFNNSGNDVRLDTFLPTGSYTVFVMDYGGTDSDNYGITIQQRRDNPNAYPLESGVTYNGELTQLSQIHVFSFEGNALDTISVQAGEQSFVLEPTIELFDPDGNLLSTASGASSAALPATVLPVTGSYTIFFSDDTGADVGLYNIGIQKIESVAIPFGEWYPFSTAENFLFRGVTSVPDIDNLFVLVKKSNRVGYANTWKGTLSLFKDQLAVVEEDDYESILGGSSTDIDVHLIDPVPGVYTVDVQVSNEDGEGFILLTDELPSLQLGAWETGEILRPYGYDWKQVDVPTGVDTLFVRTEGFGLWSTLEVFYQKISPDNNQKWFFNNWGAGYFIEGKIPSPQAGRYYIRYKDSAVLQSDASGNLYTNQGDQKREYLIKADGNPVLPNSALGLTINGFSTDTVGKGSVTLEIYGTGFKPHQMVTVTKIGQSDILGKIRSVSVSGLKLKVQFDFSDAVTGEWSLKIIDPVNSVQADAPKKIIVIDESEPVLWADFISKSQVRVGRKQTIIVRYGNSGYVDVRNNLLFLKIPAFMIDSIHLPVSFFYEGDVPVKREDNFILLSLVPARSERTFEITIKPESVGTYRFEVGFVDSLDVILPDLFAKDHPNSENEGTTENQMSFTQPLPGESVYQKFIPPNSGISEPTLWPAHVGMYVEENGTGYVIEYLDDNMIYKRPFDGSDWNNDKYIGKAHPPGWTEQKGQEAAQHALDMYNSLNPSGQGGASYKEYFVLPVKPTQENCNTFVKDLYNDAGLDYFNHPVPINNYINWNDDFGFEGQPYQDENGVWHLNATWTLPNEAQQQFWDVFYEYIKKY